MDAPAFTYGFSASFKNSHGYCLPHIEQSWSMRAIQDSRRQRRRPPHQEPDSERPVGPALEREKLLLPPYHSPPSTRRITIFVHSYIVPFLGDARRSQSSHRRRQETSLKTLGLVGEITTRALDREVLSSQCRSLRSTRPSLRLLSIRYRFTTFVYSDIAYF